MHRKNIALVALIVAALLQVSPVPLRAWALDQTGFVPGYLSNRAIPIKAVTEADLNKDGLPEEIFLVNGVATINSAGRTVWQSPGTWRVLQAEITDLNGDKTPEATLLVWRPFRPWPVDEWLPSGGRISTFHDINGNSCHIILIGWQNGKYAELWAGSALAEPVNSFSAVDLNSDGIQELITLESTYADSRSAPARELKVWQWNGFGFSVVSTMEGVFNKMAPVRSSDGHILILVP